MKSNKQAISKYRRNILTTIPTRSAIIYGILSWAYELLLSKVIFSSGIENIDLYIFLNYVQYLFAPIFILWTLNNCFNKKHINLSFKNIAIVSLIFSAVYMITMLILLHIYVYFYNQDQLLKKDGKAIELPMYYMDNFYKAAIICFIIFIIMALIYIGIKRNRSVG